MKKNILTITMALLLVGAGDVRAENVVTTNEVIIRPGGTTELTVSLENDADFAVYAYDFRLNLPEGIEVVQDSYGSLVYALGARNATHAANVQRTSDGAVQFGISSAQLAIAGTSGAVLGIKLKADNTLEEGTVLLGRIRQVTMANKEAQTVHPADMAFAIKVSNVVVLDENAIMVPDATSEAVDIVVKRSIRAGEWSTICLPFAMSADKMKAAFGDDYHLAYISGCKTEKDGDDVVGVTVEFTARTTAAQVNRPYIIRVSRDITQFEVNARIAPEDGYKTSVTKEDDETGEEFTVCAMTGNLKSGTAVPDKSLFLNDNKFYYSVGKTRLKAFRAYFTLNDVLRDVTDSESRIVISLDDETTAVGTQQAKNAMDDYYDLQGRRVKPTARKGLYIRNNQKVVIR